jgi:hypothetical protein
MDDRYGRDRTDDCDGGNIGPRSFPVDPSPERFRFLTTKPASRAGSVGARLREER